MYSILAFTVLIRRTSNSCCLRRLNVSSSNSVRKKRCHCNITHTTTVEVQVHCNHTRCIQIRRVCTKDVTTWANSILNWFPSMSLGTRLSLGLYSALVLTRRAWERGKPRDCTLYWCSPGELGNKVSLGIVLRTGAHQRSLGMRLALELYSVQVLTRGAGERGYISLDLYSALVLTRGALDRGKPWACTLYLCSPGEQGNEASPGILYSALVLSRGAWNEGSLGLVLHTGAHRSNSANLELLVSLPLERHIFQFCQTEMTSLECHRHIHSSSTSTLYPYKVHPNKKCLYAGCHYLG